MRLIQFYRDFNKFKNLIRESDNWKNRIIRRAILNESTNTTKFDSHYVYHPAWALRVVKKINPSVHIDISSSLHFCTTLSAFIKTEFYDYRPVQLDLSNLKCLKADLTNLPFETNSIESISCMHTIEHIGLGRYGDPLDPHGDMKAISELKRVTKIGGSLIIVTPLGVPIIEFNAQRIYGFGMITSLFDSFELKEFSLITDDGKFLENANPKLVESQRYGCGCFWFIKK